MARTSSRAGPSPWHRQEKGEGAQAAALGVHKECAETLYFALVDRLTTCAVARHTCSSCTRDRGSNYSSITWLLGLEINQKFNGSSHIALESVFSTGLISTSPLRCIPVPWLFRA